MNQYRLTFFLIYLALFIYYVIVETKRPSLQQKIGKILLASAYLFFATVNFFGHHLIDNPLMVTLFIALIFCYGGDLILIWQMKVGAGFFAIGNLLLGIVEVVILCEKNYFRFPYLFISIIAYICILGTMICITKNWQMSKKTRNLGKVYFSSVTLQGALAILLLVSNINVASNFFSTGLIMFMFSDYILAFHEIKYPKNNVLLRTNSILYFTGIFLISLALSFF